MFILDIIIRPSNDGFLVINLDKAEKLGFKKAHTHIKSKAIARTVRDNVMRNKFPKTRNEYLLISHIRISNDKQYINKILELIRTRRKKGRSKYVNVKGVRV